MDRYHYQSVLFIPLWFLLIFKRDSSAGVSKGITRKANAPESGLDHTKTLYRRTLRKSWKNTIHRSIKFNIHVFVLMFFWITLFSQVSWIFMFFFTSVIIYFMTFLVILDSSSNVASFKLSDSFRAPLFNVLIFRCYCFYILFLYNLIFWFDEFILIYMNSNLSYLNYFLIYLCCFLSCKICHLLSK